MRTTGASCSERGFEKLMMILLQSQEIKPTDAKLEINQAGENKWKFPIVSEQTEDNHQSYKSIYVSLSCCVTGFPGCTGVKNLPANAGDTRDARDEGLIPGWGKSPGGGNGDPLQYSCLENSMDRGTWWATVHRVTKSWTRLRTCTCLLPVALVVVVFISH